MKVTRERKLRWFIPLVFFFSIIIDSALPAIFPAEFLADSQRIVSHLMLYWVITFALQHQQRKEKVLIVYDEQNQYTPAFVALTQDFYLKM